MSGTDLSRRSGAPPMSATAIGSLVAGVLGVLFFFFPTLGFIFGGVAVVLGIFAVRSANRGETSGRGIAIAGIVLGAVALALVLVFATTSVTTTGGTPPR
jgi:heme/copper-type cytochrome/quinol oxidase subunit 2